MIYRYSYSDELYHHGILGQKWGRRNYQNPDGSLTALGRVRYGVGNARDKVVTSANKAGASIKAAYKVHKRNANLKRARQAKEKKAEEAKKLEEDRAKYSKSREQMYKHRDLYSKDELNSAKARFDAEDSLKPKGDTKVEKARKAIDYAKKWMDSIKGIYQSYGDFNDLINKKSPTKTFSQKKSEEYLNSLSGLSVDELVGRAESIQNTKNVLTNLYTIDTYRQGKKDK